MPKRTSFSSLNTLATCRDCGKRTHSSIDGCVDVRLCRSCFDAAGMENAHFDGHHTDEADADCKYCKNEGRV